MSRRSEPATTSRLGDIRRRLRGTSGRGRRLRGLLGLLRPYRLRVAAMFATLVVGTAAALAPAPLAKLAIDDGITAGNRQTLTLVVIAFVVAAGIVWAATYAQTYLVEWVGQRALADLRIAIFDHLQKMPIGFYERRPAGVLISRMTNDVEALDDLVTDSVVTLFQASLTLIGTLVILMALDLKLALLTFTVVPVIMVGSLAFRIASADAYRRTRETIGGITSNLQETLSGIRVVRAFGQERRHVGRFAELNEANRAANMTTVYLNAAYFPAIEMVSALGTVAILIYGGYQAIDGAITIGVIVAFIAALSNFFDPITQLSQLYTTYQSGMAALDKIFELLDVEPDLVEAPDAVELGRLRGEIRFEGVTFAYPTGRPAAGRAPDGGVPSDLEGDLPGIRSGRPEETAVALESIDLVVEPGQTVALVGATGAGKSTFAKLVARFYDPTAGRILVDGHDLRDVQAASLRRQMGIVPQEAFLFSGTVGENIAFGRPDASLAEIRAAAAAVGADEFISTLDDGYDTEVGERGAQISAGQRQLLAFARALIADPRILVLDEATSNVDLHTEGRIEAGLQRLLTGRTALVIAHRLSTIRSAGRIVVLDHGRIVEQGTHDELIAAGGAYWDLYRDWSEQTALATLATPAVASA
ncbi:MAG: ATP-binding cassette, subfamily bacterial [Solirubrobacteraceae bacterium]|nr:ATP-binding cassette, subfamily bacterial [Solirubrobacteraceae bacterium]